MTKLDIDDIRKLPRSTREFLNSKAKHHGRGWCTKLTVDPHLKVPFVIEKNNPYGTRTKGGDFLPYITRRFPGESYESSEFEVRISADLAKTLKIED